MKRIFLMAVVSAGVLVPSLVLVSNAGAANPHGTPPGHPGAVDPNASCGGSSGGKPSGQCNSQNLPFSEGCQHGQAPNQNPHCQGQAVTTPPGDKPGITPSPSAPAAGAPAGGVAGAEGQGGAQGGPDAENKLAAKAAQGAAGGKLPFTGLETLWLTLLGAGMLASGLALRARSGSSA
jgi:hypothetical protein